MNAFPAAGPGSQPASLRSRPLLKAPSSPPPRVCHHGALAANDSGPAPLRLTLPSRRQGNTESVPEPTADDKKFLDEAIKEVRPPRRARGPGRHPPGTCAREAAPNSRVPAPAGLQASPVGFSTTARGPNQRTS